MKCLHQLSTLHRHLVRDAGWFGNHEQLGEWYGRVAEQLDDLTETGLSLGYSEPSIKDAVLQFGGDILPAVPRELKETFTNARQNFHSMAGMMAAAKPTVPPDVQNKLDEYVYYWNKEANYKLAYALGNAEKSDLVDTADDD